MFVFLYVCVRETLYMEEGGGWLQIVLGPLDPSQSEWSCLSSSALDSRGTLICPDSQPQEMMGCETTQSPHVTYRTGTGGFGGCWTGRENMKATRQYVLTIADAEAIALLGTRQTKRTIPWRVHAHTDKIHTHVLK